MAVLVDTGVLLGAIDADDAEHQRAVDTLDRYAGQLLVPATVIAETAWQARAQSCRPETEAALVDAVHSR